MSRGYQRLEEMDEKISPEPRARTTNSSAPVKLGHILVIAVLIMLLGATLFYTAKFKGQADTLKAMAASSQRDALALNQQIKVLEEERNALAARVNDLAARLKSAELEKSQLQKETGNTRKTRKASIKKPAKRA